jgi:hypothetical protein
MQFMRCSAELAVSFPRFCHLWGIANKKMAGGFSNDRIKERCPCE